MKLFKPENGQAGTSYLHPNEAGVKVLGTYWGKAIGKAVLWGVVRGTILFAIIVIFKSNSIYENPAYGCYRIHW